ncbi:MAG: SNF2-related protein [Saprospiraceae bacterium]
MENNIFNVFRRGNEPQTRSRTVEEFFFRIESDEFGAFITVVDEKNKPVEISYLNYSGAKRNVLRQLEQISEKNSFVIDWEKSSDNIYLAEYDYLMQPLSQCDNLIDHNRLLLTFSEVSGQFKLNFSTVEQTEEEENPLIESVITLQHGSEQHIDFQPLTEEWVLVDGKIISVAPLGTGFQYLPYFTSSIRKSELPVFLSLLFTNLQHIDVQYGNYSIEHSRDKIHAKPSLIFEKIDVEDSLFLRVGQVLPEMDVNVLEQFDLYRYAEINDLESRITTKIIEREPLEDVLDGIYKMLKRHQPKGVKKADRTDIVWEGDLFIIPKETAANFIYNELPNLLTQFQIFGADKLKSYKISTNMPSVSMNLSHGIDFFEGDVTLGFGDEQVNLFDVINQYRKQNYVLLSDGTHALLNEQYVKKLERIFNKKKDKAQLSFFDLPLVEELINDKITDKAFSRPRKFYEGLNDVPSKRYRLPEVEATLRPYQKQGYKWLRYLNEFGLGGCLADDMGLGKTLQTITLLATFYPEQEKPTLIVMPRSLLFNWNAEVERFAPQMTTYTFYGNNRNVQEAMHANLIFTTYAIMRNSIEELKDQDFYYVILDESQNIKNVNALTTKAAMLLHSDHRLALSGTPIENNLGELYSLFRFLNPSMFGTLHRFNQDYLQPIQKDNDKTAVLSLRKKIYPFVLRRLKRDVLKDLPDKIEQTLFIEMSPEQKKLYEKRRVFYQMAVNKQIQESGLQSTRFFVFQALNELRQIASVPESISDGRVTSTKRELLQEQLMDAFANNHKVLIFVNYLAAIELISKQLDEAGIDFVSMTGATRDRQSLVERFQKDPNCRAFLMTLKTGGTGLNLTAADTIFIFDPWWNVAAENQAIDRAHRIGQENKVLAYKLITEGTIEEKIMKLQQLKKELFDNVISSDGAGMKSLSEDDIDFIFS